MEVNDISRSCDGCGGPPRRCKATNDVISLKRCSRCKQCFYHDIKCQRRHYKIHKIACRMVPKESASPNQMCDGCGAPPRRCESTAQIIPLKQCSRCLQCYYHDTECQRKHYKIHKISCRFVPTASLPPNGYFPASTSFPQHEWFKVRSRKDGEKGLFATRHIDASPVSTLKLSLSSLVPPVLYETNRKSHCALCFQPVGSNSIVLSKKPEYWVTLCSKKCYEASCDWLLDEVFSVLWYLQRGPPCTSILHASVCVYRVLKNALWDDVMAMRSPPPFAEDDSPLGIIRFWDTVCRKTLVVEQVLNCFLADDSEKRRLVQRNGSKRLLNDELILEFYKRVQINAFSIVVKNKPLDIPGEGLFDDFSYRINHSCMPNALQRFDLIEGQAPKLCVDIFFPLEAGEEVFISYGEFINFPLRRRREAIAQKYHFHCRCQRCMSEELSHKLHCSELWETVSLVAQALATQSE